MPCYRPIVGFKPPDGGALVFHEVKDHREVKIRCGQCIGCRVDRIEHWAVRCYAESKCHQSNLFITMTYENEHLPQGNSLCYRDVQLLNKRLRKKYGPFRFFVCGEYGDQTFRPHYHMLAFGLSLPDLKQCNSVYSRDPLFTSSELDEVWGKGKCTVGGVTYASARYCAAYIGKRITGELADSHYERVDIATGEVHKVVPEFAKMSLRPGIGELWLKKYWKDLYVTGHRAVIINGQKQKIPPYFDSKMMELFPDVVEAHKLDQYKEAIKRYKDNSAERLAVREEIAHAKRKFNKERFPNDL